MQAEVRSKNKRLERDNEAFRESVVSTLTAVDDIVTQCFQNGQEVCNVVGKSVATTSATG